MWIENLRTAYRSLRSAPGFTITAILSLAIGIGGSVAMFTLVNSIVLKPLTYPDSGRLVRVTNVSSKNIRGAPGLLPLQFTRWRKQIQSFESIALAGMATNINLTGSGRPETLGAMRITSEFLDTLKVQPQLGRWFNESEEKRGMPNVVILSDSLWRRRFSADPGIIGRKILLNDAPYEITGIAPPDLRLFRGRQLHLGVEMPDRADIFLPIRFSAQEEQGAFRPNYVAIARLKPGITPEQARAELDAAQAEEHRKAFALFKVSVAVQPLQTVLVGDVRKGLLILLFSVGLVLLIACANVANLSLVRAIQRSRELAIRTALGARRSDLVRSSLTESFLVAIGGTVAGSILSMWITDIVLSRVPSQLPRIEETVADVTVFGFAVAVCVLTTVLFGWLPAARASQADPQQALNAAGRGSTDTPRGGRLRAALVSAEVAFGTVLVIGSGLLLISFHHVMNIPRGFDGHDVLIADFLLPSPRYQALEKQVSFFRSVHDGVASIPGVLHVAANTRLPLDQEVVDIALPEGSNMRIEERPLTAWASVSAEYFGAMKIPLRAGRLFQDGGETERVAVVSESAARILWPGENPLGKRVSRPVTENPDVYWRVIGIAGDVRSSGLDRTPPPAIYRPYVQQGGRPTAFSIVIQTGLTPAVLAAPVREAVSRVDPDIPVPEIRTMPGMIADSVQSRRFQAALLASFALVAVLLAAVGIYGVVGSSMLQRRKEIGVRIALGANRQHVSQLIFRNGMTPVAVGLAGGLLGAAFFARLMASLLFQVKTLDPIAFLAAPLVLVLAAAMPCWLTARQAARIDPMVALRLE